MFEPSSAWLEFASALALFLATHIVPARPKLRARLVGGLGRRGFLIAYSLVSVVLLWWLIAAAGHAPLVQLWPRAPWQPWVPNLVMPLVCLLVALAIGAPNPLSFGGAHPEHFDPRRPGIVGLARHPMLVALALWALAHLVANGDLAHVVLFGGFGAFAFVGMMAIDRRKRREKGEVEWRRLAGVGTGARLGGFGGRAPLRLASGLALYLALLMAHRPVIGVSPLP